MINTSCINYKQKNMNDIKNPQLGCMYNVASYPGLARWGGLGVLQGLPPHARAVGGKEGDLGLLGAEGGAGRAPAHVLLTDGAVSTGHGTGPQPPYQGFFF